MAGLGIDSRTNIAATMTSFMDALRTGSLEAPREIDGVRHGLAAAQSEPVMRFLANYSAEHCPTSNVMLGTVQSPAAHPIRKLFDAGDRDHGRRVGVWSGCFGGVSAPLPSQALRHRRMERIRLAGLTDPRR
ncbi:hypothetical protein G6N73_09105 [Mesorhizobium camelthorni]|uniref:Adenosine deaminase domain-containing protein n=1 Tax=Allomesorhizobium camelthorni TaxID=475069 RepID=A0A6G4W986_9HYPH|nr:hypothetical protein [Mesorhizobium camelthorni]